MNNRDDIRDNQRKACNELFTNNILRFGTTIQNIEDLMKVVNEVKPTNSLLSKTKSSNTLILKYTSNLNFIKFITITCITNPPHTGGGKNYHILNGDKINFPTIAIRRFSTSIYVLPNLQNAKILIPNNIERHVTYFEDGKFFECNQTLASRIPANTSYVIPNEAVKLLANLVDKLIVTGQIPFLGFGTLLGWYRDCGLIPYTRDVDFYIFANQYIEGFEDAFFNDPQTPLVRTIGKQAYGLQLTYKLNHNIPEHIKPLIDFFYLYENNFTSQWSSTLISLDTLERSKYVIPKVKELCTGDINGYLFFVPCNFLDILKANYGPNWDTPDPDPNYFDGQKQVFKDDFWNATIKEIIIRY